MTIASEQHLLGTSKARRPSVSSIPPSMPVGEEDEWLAEFASAVMAQGRGIDRDASFASRLFDVVKRVLAGVVLLPVALVAGAGLGLFMAPMALFLRTSWPKRLVAFVFAVPAIALFAGFLALKFAVTGSVVVGLPRIAALVQARFPFVCLPEAIRHHMFGLVLVTRHADVREVFERNDVFKVDIYDERMRATSGAFFLGMDPGGAYDSERRVGAEIFGRSFDALEKFTHDLCNALVNEARKRTPRTIDVVSEFAQLVPIAVLREYFGIQDTPDERLRGWLQATGFFIFNFWIGGVYRAHAADAGASLAQHLGSVVAERDKKRRAGEKVRDDVLGRMLLAFAPTPSDPLADVDRDFIVRMLGGLASGTSVPTIGLSVAIIDRLLDLPAAEARDLRNAARAGNDDRIAQYVREAGRFCTYPPMLYRHAAKAYMFDPAGDHQTTAQRGALVVTAPFLANFDPSVFVEPQAFNPDRKELKEVMLFGWDRHRCLGEHVGLMMMTEMVKALFANPVRRLSGAAGRVVKGARGVIPDGDFPNRLVARIDD